MKRFNISKLQHNGSSNRGALKPMPIAHMSNTTSRRTVLRRVATGLSIVALTTGVAVVMAPAAHATGGTVVTVSRSGSEMNVIGRSRDDSITLTGGSASVRVSVAIGSVVAGSGCQQVGSAVQCSNGSTGIKLVVVNGFDGDDAVRNDTAVRSALFGGRGNDRLTGGSGNDKIIGGLDVDFAFGRGGTDACTAENESSCEQ